MLSVKTCNREDIYYSDKNCYKFDYIPLKGIEDKACPLTIDGYEIGLGRHSWAYIDFMDEIVPAVLKCNGKESFPVGSSVCQTKVGLIESIEFIEEMKTDLSQKCVEFVTKDNKVFMFKPNKGVCVVAFKSKSNEFHRLSIIGYEDVLIRK